MKGNSRYLKLKKVSFITIIINALLAFFKIVIGYFSQSTAVMSDGVHTFSDIFTTVLVIAGLRLSDKDADAEHPYGHQRIESLISLLLAFVLAITALYLGYEGMAKIFSGTNVHFSTLALVITIISILSKEWMFHYTMRAAKNLNSTSMISDAWHHRTDALSSVAVLIGVIGVFFGFGILDPIVTIAVCLVILKASLDIGKSAVNQLIDRAVSKETEAKIRELILTVNGVRNIDLLKTRISNHVIFVELEVAVNPNITVREGHDIAQKLHDLLEGGNLSIQHCMVHVNPGKS